MDEEIRVIQRVIRGDTGCFKTLVERYEKPIFRVAWNILQEGHLAEDIAQDVFLTAFKKLKSFDPSRSRFSTWLFTIARRKCLNALRKKRERSLTGIPEGADTRTPADCYREREYSDLLDRELEQMPAAQKTAFILAEVEGLSYQDIAAIEGIRLGTVKSRINRARERLKRVLQLVGVKHEG